MCSSGGFQQKLGILTETAGGKLYLGIDQGSAWRPWPVPTAALVCTGGWAAEGFGAWAEV